MNANAPKTASESGNPGNPGKRATRTHRKERTVPHRKHRRAQKLLKAYRETGDTAVRDQLYQDYLHLAELYAKKYFGRGVDWDDLLQEARLGLLKAIERYDPLHKATFVTYASNVIDGQIKMYFRDKAWPCTAPRAIKGYALRVKRMERTLGRCPTKQEILDAGVIPAAGVDAALAASQAWSSAYLGQSDVALAESWGDRCPSFVEPGYERASNLIDMEAAMRKLGKDEMDAALLYYFGHLTQREIAKQLDASPASVSILLRKATKKLGRDFMEMYRAS